MYYWITRAPDQEILIRVHTDLENPEDLELSENFESPGSQGIVREFRQRSGKLNLSQRIFSLKLLLCFNNDLLPVRSGRREFQRQKMIYFDLNF